MENWLDRELYKWRRLIEDFSASPKIPHTVPAVERDIPMSAWILALVLRTRTIMEPNWAEKGDGRIAYIIGTWEI